MKRSLAFILFVLGLNVIVHAQNTDTTAQPLKTPNPAKQAARQLKMLQQQLNLTDDQVLDLQVILIHRDVALDSINREADLKISALLSEDQKTLYRQWKQLRQQRQAPPPAKQ